MTRIGHSPFNQLDNGITFKRLLVSVFGQFRDQRLLTEDCSVKVIAYLDDLLIIVTRGDSEITRRFLKHSEGL